MQWMETPAVVAVLVFGWLLNRALPVIRKRV